MMLWEWSRRNCVRGAGSSSGFHSESRSRIMCSNRFGVLVAAPRPRGGSPLVVTGQYIHCDCADCQKQAGLNHLNLNLRFRFPSFPFNSRQAVSHKNIFASCRLFSRVVANCRILARRSAHRRSAPQNRVYPRCAMNDLETQQRFDAVARKVYSQPGKR